MYQRALVKLYYRFRVIRARGSIIPNCFGSINFQMYISRGFSYRSTKSSFWHVGFRFGTFARTRKLAMYKSKVKKKKREKMKRDLEKQQRRLRRRVYVKYKTPASNPLAKNQWREAQNFQKNKIREQDLNFKEFLKINW